VIIDLDARTVLRVIDTGVMPVPAATHDFDEASVGALTGLRPPLKPIRITQPAGVNFSVQGGFVEWQKWRFHMRFDRRTGPVVSLVSYAGRPVMYQGSLSEIFVPYQDADPNWFYRTYMDNGEFGFGLLASPLKPGLDVPENAMLFDAVVSAAIPDPNVPVVPLPLQGVIGVFERVTGNPAWRHFELFSGGAYEGRAEVELLVRSIAQVGNYDYLLDWVFTQHGVIRGEVGLTGIDAPKGVGPGGGDPAQSSPVAAQLVAPFHSHFFNFRLDMDVDGPANRFVLGHLHTRNVPGPRKSVWSLEEHVLASEREGRIAPEGHGRWKVVNHGKHNAFGLPTGYLVETHDTAEPLLKKQDYQRASFIENALWITAFDPDQRYAAGDTPNQHPGAPGLPQYQRDNQSLLDTDIVLWLTLGHHHVTQAEDWPVLSRHRLAFELKPMNFFDRNPALDLRRAPFEVVR
jgi:primary-amine oxidase